MAYESNNMRVTEKSALFNAETRDASISPGPLQGVFPLYELVHTLELAIAAEFDTRIEEKITLRQFVLLRAIAQNDGTNQVGVSLATRMDRSTISDMARRLRERGFMERRRRRTDARSYVLRLTESGEMMVAIGSEVLQAIEDRVLAPLSTQGRTEFLQLLRHASAGALAHTSKDVARAAA